MSRPSDRRDTSRRPPRRDPPMSRPHFTLETDSRGVARLTLDRAERHNVLAGETCDGLAAAAASINADAAIRVVVLAGRGASFCAGGDLEWMRAQAAANGAGRRVEARRLADMLAALNTLDRPLIGRIHGSAYGGGVGLMAVCDSTVVAEDARFGLTETRLGLIPATIAPYVIARMGEGPARSVFFSGRVFDAGEALRLNLATRVVAPEDLDAAVEAEVDALSRHGPRGSGRGQAARSVARATDRRDRHRGLDRSARCDMGRCRRPRRALRRFSTSGPRPGCAEVVALQCRVGAVPGTACSVRNLQGDMAQHRAVGAGEHDHRRLAGLPGFLPALGAEAPAVARVEPGESRSGRGWRGRCRGLGRRRGIRRSRGTQTVWQPESSGPVLQQPSRKKPVRGSTEQGFSGSSQNVQARFAVGIHHSYPVISRYPCPSWLPVKRIGPSQ